MNRYIPIFLWGVLWLGPPPLLAQSFNPSRLEQKVWQTQQGLPDNALTGVLQTHNGYLWLASLQGLARFDGQTFRVFNTSNTPAFKDNLIRTLYEDRTGVLWIGSATGLTRFQNGQFGHVDLGPFSTPVQVYQMQDDQQGALWCATNNGLYKVSRSGVVRYTTDYGLPSNVVFAITNDQHGHLWVGTLQGLAEFDHDRFVVHALGKREDKSVFALAASPAGVLWAGTLNGLYAYQQDHVQAQYTVRDGLASNKVFALFRDADDRLWVGTSVGISLLENGSLHQLPFAQWKHALVNAIASDAEGNIWVATLQGLVRIKDLGFSRFLDQDVAGGEKVMTLLPEDDGSLLLAGTQGVLRYQAGCFKQLPGFEPSGSVVISLLREPDGTILAATNSTGIVATRRGHVVRSLPHSSMQKISAQSLSLAHDGTLWAGTAEGLWHRVGDHWVRYTREQGLPNDLVETVREDHEGALWFSTAAGGVGRLSGSAMENWRERDGFVESITFVIEETTGVDSLERVLWFGHESGLVLRRHHRFVRFGPQNGVPPGVTGVLDDERGQIWIHSSSGIFHAPKQQFFAVAEGRQSRVQLKEFGTRSEIGALKPSVAFRKSAIRGTDGLLWFNTISGVIAVDPTWEIHNTVPPPVMVDSVFKDRSGVDQTSVVIVPASVQTLEIRYAGLSFVTPERVYFRYKLDGYDRTWIEAGTRRTAFYTHLPPGQYRFEVLATNNEGVWSQTSAFQQIRIEPQWHQTWWWYTVCATLFGLAIWQIQQLRVRHIRSRFALVLSERTRIARELHDTLLQGFAGISWQLEGVSRSLFSAPEESKRQLDQLLEEVDRCLREARHTISYMRLPALTDNRLAAALLQAGEQLTAQTRTQFSLRVIGVPSSWPYTVESNLFLVGREAITNAVAHAQAREIRVELQYGEDGLRLSIHDNGCGFDPEDPALGQNEHWGLVGMRERVNQVGGNLSLRSVLGQGTCIEILLPPIPATARMQRRSDRETVKK